MFDFIFKNPMTSTAGLGLLLTNLGPVLTMVGSGAPLVAVFADPHFSALMAGFGALAAKDFNVTGGTK